MSAGQYVHNVIVNLSSHEPGLSIGNLKGTEPDGSCRPVHFDQFDPHAHDTRRVSDNQGRTRGRGRASARKGTTGTRGRKTRDQGGGTTSKRGDRATRRSRGPAVEHARGAIAFDGFLDAADSQLGPGFYL